MNSFLKKSWLIFSILAFAGLLTLGTSSYLKYNELKRNLITEQRYVTQLFDSHLSSAFFQFETMLDLVGYEYNAHHGLREEVIDNVLSRAPLLVGFALFNTNGELESSSDSLRPVNFGNLLKHNKTQHWFQKSFTKNTMTIDKPYYLKGLKMWIIPIHKRVVNSQGEVTGVVTSGLDLRALSKQWREGVNGQLELQATLDDGLFPILRANLPFDKYDEVYTSPHSGNRVQRISEELTKQNSSLDKLRESGEILQLQVKFQQNENFITLLFNPEHQIWVSASDTHHSLNQRFIPQFTALSFFYLLFIVVIYFLFKWIARIESDKLAELTYRAEHDLLTGLYNRSVLKTQSSSYHKKNAHFTLIYVDLDHFKSINDSYGYNYGDTILVEVSKRIGNTIAPFDGDAIRLNADAFIILIKSIENTEIINICKALLSNISAPYRINNNDLKLSASIGIAQTPKDATGIETLISYAHNSMQMAKETKNHYVFFSEKIHQQLIKDLEIEQALHRAIGNNEISLVYQPQVDNQQQLCGVEALVRWNNPTLGFIPPDKFIPIAEKTGFMPELADYIMNRAMEEISALQNNKKVAFQLSINVSARQFIQTTFLDNLIDCLAFHRSDYMKVTIEITESLFIENIERLLPIFEKMKNENISLSLDDFGTGYSSLSMLKNIPIDELKIDKSFVDYIVNNNNDRAMVSSIIAMGKNLGMKVLAEGVEDKLQADILQGAGCDIYQGYYFSKPLNLIDLEKYIDTL